MEGYDLYCKFDADKHKEKYINYLEVVITEDGRIEYAVPSHQEKAISIACNKLKVDRGKLCDMCPPEYYFDFGTWLSEIAKVVFVWNEFCLYKNINERQAEALKMLKEKGIYKGTVPLYDI